MKFSEKIQKDIVELFKGEDDYNKEMRQQLLDANFDAVISLTIDNKIDYKEVLEALDPENEEKKKLLIIKAKKNKLYFDMLDEIQSVNYVQDSTEKKM